MHIPLPIRHARRLGKEPILVPEDRTALVAGQRRTLSIDTIQNRPGIRRRRPDRNRMLCCVRGNYATHDGDRAHPRGDFRPRRRTPHILRRCALRRQQRGCVVDIGNRVVGGCERRERRRRRPNHRHDRQGGEKGGGEVRQDVPQSTGPSHGAPRGPCHISTRALVAVMLRGAQDQTRRPHSRGR